MCATSERIFNKFGIKALGFLLFWGSDDFFIMRSQTEACKVEAKKARKASLVYSDCTVCYVCSVCQVLANFAVEIVGNTSF